MTVASNRDPLTEQEMQLLRLLPLDGSTVHVLQTVPSLRVSLNEGRALAKDLAARSLVLVDGDMVKLPPAGAA